VTRSSSRPTRRTLALQGHRGQRNEPAFVAQTLAVVAPPGTSRGRAGTSHRCHRRAPVRPPLDLGNLPAAGPLYLLIAEQKAGAPCQGKTTRCRHFGPPARRRARRRVLRRDVFAGRAAPTGGYAGGAGSVTDASKGNIPTVQGSAPNQQRLSRASPSRPRSHRHANIAMKSDDPWQTRWREAIAVAFGGSIVGLPSRSTTTGAPPTSRCACPPRASTTRFTRSRASTARWIQSSVEAKDVNRPSSSTSTPASSRCGRRDALPAALRQREDRRRDAQVQIALSQLRQQIEQLAAAQKSTKDRVAFSTISLSVASTREPLPATPGKWDAARTFAVASPRSPRCSLHGGPPRSGSWSSARSRCSWSLDPRRDPRRAEGSQRPCQRSPHRTPRQPYAVRLARLVQPLHV